MLHEPPAPTCRPVLLSTGLVLWCGSNRVRIGDGTRAHFLDGVSSQAMTWLHALDGRRTWKVIGAEQPAADALRLFRAAWQAGCIDDANSRPGTWWRTGGYARQGEPGRRALLHWLGSAAAAHHLLVRRYVRRIAIVGSGPLARQALSAARAAQLQVAWVRPIDAPLPVDTACCVIADGAHPDLAGRVDLPACQVPHLTLRAFGVRAVVGPLVIPGQTSCLACAHLHHLDTTPGWSQVALQLMALTQDDRAECFDPVTARLAAVQAILLARSVVDSALPGGSDLGDRAYEWTPESLIPKVHARASHPLCGCRWDAGAA